MQSLRDGHCPRNLDEAVGHAFDTVALIWSVARKWERVYSEKTIAPRVTESRAGDLPKASML